jgi:hypothetical protein
MYWNLIFISQDHSEIASSTNKEQTIESTESEVNETQQNCNAETTHTNDLNNDDNETENDRPTISKSTVSVHAG